MATKSSHRCLGHHYGRSSPSKRLLQFPNLPSPPNRAMASTSATTTTLSRPDRVENRQDGRFCRSPRRERECTCTEEDTQEIRTCQDLRFDPLLSPPNLVCLKDSLHLMFLRPAFSLSRNQADMRAKFQPTVTCLRELG